MKYANTIFFFLLHAGCSELPYNIEHCTIHSRWRPTVVKPEQRRPHMVPPGRVTPRSRSAWASLGCGLAFVRLGGAVEQALKRTPRLAQLNTLAQDLLHSSKLIVSDDFWHCAKKRV